MVMDDKERRTIEAIQDCDRYIDREEKRDPCLRPLDVAERLDWYRAHRTKLIHQLSVAGRLHYNRRTKPPTPVTGQKITVL